MPALSKYLNKLLKRPGGHSMTTCDHASQGSPEQQVTSTVLRPVPSIQSTDRLSYCSSNSLACESALECCLARQVLLALGGLERRPERI